MWMRGDDADEEEEEEEEEEEDARGQTKRLYNYPKRSERAEIATTEPADQLQLGGGRGDDDVDVFACFVFPYLGSA